jgi:hypothetical protein
MAVPTRSQLNERQKKSMTIINELRAVRTDSLTQVEDIVSYLALAKAVRKEFEEHASLVEAPEWLDNLVRSLNRELKVKTADVLEKRLREAQARRESLKTAEERRKAADEEIARLTEKRDKIGV